jgi:DNA-directed RNA polymerase subunit RPC12/RpoP
MKTYFCPRCGRGFESAQCHQATGSFQVSMRCPECDVSVEISGVSLIIVGFLVWVFCSSVIDMFTPIFGAFVGGSLGSVGMIRLVRQFLVAKKFSRFGK